MEQVKLLSMTAVLTVLIWASADSLVNETGSVRVRFDVVARDDPDMLVTVAPAAKSRVYELEVFGPRKIVEQIESRDRLPIRLPIPDHPTGTASIRLSKNMLQREIARQWNEFRKLRVIAAQPETLDIVVDHMVTKEAAIVMKRAALPYDDKPHANRPSVLVHMRESVYRELEDAGDRLQLDIGADVDRLFRARPAGETVTVSVPVDARAFGPDATLEPDRVEVTATVKADRTTADVPTVPIKPVVSFANLAKPYRAVGRDGTTFTLVTQTIKVTGPTEDVNRLLRGETRAYGFVQLKEADLEDLNVYKAWVPEFHLPPGIELADKPKPIEFKLSADPEETTAG